ncbi:hypothetical protein ACVEIO_024000 (plasmid) [Klebsiella aerogenes]
MAPVLFLLFPAPAPVPLFFKTGAVNIRLAVLLEVATTAGAVTGVILVGIASTTSLYLLFSGILAISVIQMLSRRKETGSDTAVCRRGIAEKLALNSSYYDPLTKTHVRYAVGNVPNTEFCYQPLGYFLSFIKRKR